MKKLLSSLMVLTLLSSTSSIVVSCARGPKMHPIETKFSKSEINGVEYKPNEMQDAFNGTPVTFYGNVHPLNQLSRNIFNLLGFNQSLVTQPSRIKLMREFYIGQDEVEASPDDIYFTPSVDGTFYGEKVLGKSQAEFYNLYNKTQINSIAGLYNLYLYDQKNPGLISAEGALNSLKAIQSSFDNNRQATQEFIDSFLDLDGDNYDSSWVAQTYDLGEDTDLGSLKLDSIVTPFDFQNKSEDGKSGTELIFEGSKDLGQPTGFTTLNTAVEPVANAKIGNNKSQPFDLLLLPPLNSEDILNSSSEALFDLSWTYDKDEANSLKTWDMRHPSDTLGWKFRATNETISEADAREVKKGFLKTNESMVIPLKPLKMRYEYTVNARNSFAPKYLITLEIDGLQAIFNAVGYQTRFKDALEDSKIHGNRYVKWQFSHYQFNDINNVYTPFGDSQKTQIGKGYYSGIKINSMVVERL